MKKIKLDKKQTTVLSLALVVIIAGLFCAFATHPEWNSVYVAHSGGGGHGGSGGGGYGSSSSSTTDTTDTTETTTTESYLGFSIEDAESQTVAAYDDAASAPACAAPACPAAAAVCAGISC